MRKLFISVIIIAATFILALAQQPQPLSQDSATAMQKTDETPNMGRAPKEHNGIGRADVRVFDENGNPVSNANVKLESTRTDGFFCESFAATGAKGVAVLPPIHMGRLKLIVKAKGFQTQKIDVPTSSLSDPVRVTLVRK